jgi:colanic acid/amylovoran biosynthesis glycosyltransferase
VAIVAKQFPTVSETFVLNHVTGLVDLGFDVDIYAFGAEDLPSYGHRQLEEYGLPDITTYLPAGFDRDACARRFAERGYAAVHCHFGIVAEQMAYLRTSLPAAVFVATFHGADIRRALAEGPGTLQATFGAFDWFVSICRYNRERLEQLGCPAERIIDLPNGVDPSLFLPGTRRPDSMVRIVTVARLHPDKNLAFGLQVMQGLSHAGLEFHYDVIGHGRERHNLEAQAAELGISSRVTFHGQCPQHVVAEKLAQADLFFLPSQAEASPVCILEAQACALPVVATRVGGIPELIEEGVTGFVIDSDDRHAAVDRLLQLAKRPELRERLGRNGRRNVQERHDAR